MPYLEQDFRMVSIWLHVKNVTKVYSTTSVSRRPYAACVPPSQNYSFFNYTIKALLTEKKDLHTN